MTGSGPAILTAPLFQSLGIPHFFSTRAAGNLAQPEPAEAFAQTVLPGRRLQRVRQVHGATVVTVARNDDGVPEADGLVTDDPTTIVAVRTADCVPVLLASDDGAVVAAAHAGWRGVVSGVVPETVRSIRALTRRPLNAAIGPCISSPAFEVGPEVVEAFRAAFGDAASSLHTPGRGDRSHIDLVRALIEQLRPLVACIDTAAARCTVSDSELFFSHRREAAAAGRMLSGIGTRPRLS